MGGDQFSQLHAFQSSVDTIDALWLACPLQQPGQEQANMRRTKRVLFQGFPGALSMRVAKARWHFVPPRPILTPTLTHSVVVSVVVVSAVFGVVFMVGPFVFVVRGVFDRSNACKIIGPRVSCQHAKQKKRPRPGSDSRSGLWARGRGDPGGRLTRRRAGRRRRWDRATTTTRTPRRATRPTGATRGRPRPEVTGCNGARRKERE